MIERERVVCRRCSVELSGWVVVARTPLQSLTMNADDFHALRRDGVLKR